jgi:hypothetical protein
MLPYLAPYLVNALALFAAFYLVWMVARHGVSWCLGKLSAVWNKGAADLQLAVTTVKGDLAAAQAKIVALETDVATLKAKVP